MDSEIRILKEGMFWKTISTGINAVAGFLMSVIFAKFLGKDNYGELILVYTAVSLFAAISNLGLTAALERFIPLYRNRKDERKFAGFILTTCGIELAAAGILSTLMFLLSGVISVNIFHKPVLTQYMKWGAVYLFAVTLVTNALLSIYYGLQKWKEECFLNGIYLFSSFLITFVVLAVFKKGIIEVLQANAAVALIALFAGTFYIARFMESVKMPIKFGASERLTIRETLKFSIPVFINGLLFYLVIWPDKIVLGRCRPAGELAQYYVAFALGTGIIMLIKVAEVVFTPYLAKLTGEDDAVLKKKFQIIFRMFLHLPIALSIMLYFLIDPFIRRMYGPDFGIAAAALKIYLIIIVLRSVTTPIGLFMNNVYGRTFEMTKMGAVNAVTHLGFYLILIPRYGYIGALAASIIAYIAVTVYAMLAMKEINRFIPYRSLLYAVIGIAIVLVVNFLAAFYHFYNKPAFLIILPSVYLLYVVLKKDIAIDEIRGAIRM